MNKPYQKTRPELSEQLFFRCEQLSCAFSSTSIYKVTQKRNPVYLIHHNFKKASIGLYDFDADRSK